MSRGTGVFYAPTRKNHIINEEICFYCGRDVKKWGKTRDHIVPRSKGGIETVTACLSCNGLKNNLSVEEFRLILAFRAGVVSSVRTTFLFAAEGGNPIQLLKAKLQDTNEPPPQGAENKPVAMTKKQMVEEFRNRADKAVMETLRARRELAALKATPCAAWWCRLKRKLHELTA